MDKNIFAERTPLYDSLTTYFRDVRTLKGLGMPTIANATGFHTSNLSRIERSVHRPTPDTLDRLAAADAYGCPWESTQDNAIFLRAFAYHLIHSPSYAPRNAEWWPADMTTAIAATGVITQGTTWSHSVRWSALVEAWPALGLPGWQPTAELSYEPPPSFSRPLWLWGAWGVTRELERDTTEQAAWYKNISGQDDTDLATMVMGYVLEAVSRARDGHPIKELPTLPTDPDFRAMARAWPELTATQRRLARELVETWAGAR
ncbi:MAG: hypothetical protein C7B43_20105 [Sulfobacillus benefaciens]|jgi:transcriptional regulator with XRE-family HTH domain|uniref:HTH cro/C1-type domain-containing protein n=1 Tax=Sulfobacillus benefaciens TaxID=453960 RepID=A0A2T2WM32_9FIRM|nr:MAG: hypothetical protein C7B43_20105 [Sulfobacillus benefaciens]